MLSKILHRTGRRAKSSGRIRVSTTEELADGAGNIFKVQRECVVAALKVAGVTTCTVSKAKELVDAFMKKEVK